MIIAGAGGAAHLPGMVASLTPLPVLGVPVEIEGARRPGQPLSIVQMPAGIPVGTLAIGRAGAINAALLAAAVLALVRRRRGRAGSTAGAPPRPPRSPSVPPTMNEPPLVRPGMIVGILGGGQLGRMLAAGRGRARPLLPHLLPRPEEPGLRRRRRAHRRAL